MTPKSPRQVWDEEVASHSSLPTSSSASSPVAEWAHSIKTFFNQWTRHPPSTNVGSCSSHSPPHPADASTPLAPSTTLSYPPSLHVPSRVKRMADFKSPSQKSFQSIPETPGRDRSMYPKRMSLRIEIPSVAVSDGQAASVRPTPLTGTRPKVSFDVSHAPQHRQELLQAIRRASMHQTRLEQLHGTPSAVYFDPRSPAHHTAMRGHRQSYLYVAPGKQRVGARGTSAALSPRSVDPDATTTELLEKDQEDEKQDTLLPLPRVSAVAEIPMRAVPIVLISKYTQNWKDSCLLFFVTMTIWLLGYILVPSPPVSLLNSANYCETVQLKEKVLQPANSWSCIFYVMMGCYTLFHSYNNDALVKRIKGTKVLFGLTMYALAFGSFWFHSRLSLDSSYMDTAGMMSFIGMALGISIAKWSRPIVFYIVYLGYIVMAMLIIWAMQFTMGQQLEATAYLMILGVVSAVISESVYCIYHDYDCRWNPLDAEPLDEAIQSNRFKRAIYTGRYLVSAISLLSFSYSLWNADSHRWLCLPDSWFQLHAVWHWLTSIAALLSYYHFHQ